MAINNQEWEELGRSVQSIIDQAIYSRDYEKLNQTIRQTVGRAVDLGSEVVRKAMDGGARADVIDAEAVPHTVRHPRNLPALYGSTTRKTTTGIAKVVGGGLVCGGTFLVFLYDLVCGMLWGGPVLAYVPLELAGLAMGGLLAVSGVKNLGAVKRFKVYRKQLGQKTHCAVKKLAAAVGKSEKFVRKEVKKMIGEGLFLEGHLDQEEANLITSDETYRHYEQSRLEMEARRREEAELRARKPAQTRSPQVQEVLDKGNAFIKEIRRCNDAIPGEEISAKIYHMEMIVQRIFGRAETNPEIVPDLKKMMDYYLPMTVKLLNAYADMDAQPVQGENIQNAKREIEDTLDTLNLAFEKLMDDLFADTAMDVSSDISVLKTLLAQEGLAEDDLSRMKKQKTL